MGLPLSLLTESKFSSSASVCIETEKWPKLFTIKASVSQGHHDVLKKYTHTSKKMWQSALIWASREKLFPWKCFFTAIMESSQLRGVLPSPTTATSRSPGLANADEVQWRTSPGQSHSNHPLMLNSLKICWSIWWRRAVIWAFWTLLPSTRNNRRPLEPAKCPSVGD